MHVNHPRHIPLGEVTVERICLSEHGVHIKQNGEAPLYYEARRLETIQFHPISRNLSLVQLHVCIVSAGAGEAGKDKTRKHGQSEQRIKNLS